MAVDDETTVRVAVRIRPLLVREQLDLCQTCTTCVLDEPQIIIGKDRPFTFDFLLDSDSPQSKVYDLCGSSLIEGVFDGYNATIMAYGQTGSGKTYTMGTAFDVNVDDDLLGIIPRAVNHLFDGIEKRQKEANENGKIPPKFTVDAQFMELYKEQIFDLLDTTRCVIDKDKKSQVKIHEDASGNIYTVGVSMHSVSSVDETIRCLKTGALNRVTASTNMNAQSSRSHAIFTLHIRQERTVTIDDGEEIETLSAKFHFVDLAGSERLNRTGSTGNRAEEGISINCGLLALGNVISALGDKTKRGSHVPYRDSRLTRLLQDSLGGNSRTVMIACISPCDRDFMETLNTLQYANRARNIKNKVVVNQDKSSRQIMALRQQIAQLTTELNEYKLGHKTVDADGVECINDMFSENTMLQEENNRLRIRIKALQTTLDNLTDRNAEVILERDLALISSTDSQESNGDVGKKLSDYIKEIEKLKQHLLEKDNLIEQLLKQPSMSKLRSSKIMTPINDTDTQSLIEMAKKEVNQLKGEIKYKENRTNSGSTDGEDLEENLDVEDELSEEMESALNEELDSNSDDDYESTEEKKMNEELADLTSEISVKQQLIDELELNQKRLKAVRSQYEAKLSNLEQRIKETEKERDQALNSIPVKEHRNNDEKVKAVRETYEKKLRDLRGKLQYLHKDAKEHSRLLKKSRDDERQLAVLNRDISEMKKIKVRLINQMKENSAKYREKDVKYNRQLAQLKKDQRLQATKIKSLETEKRKKDLILKRKTEEVEALRKRNRSSTPSSVRRSESGGNKSKAKSADRDKLLNRKWVKLENAISSITSKRRTMMLLEKDMEIWVKQRGKLSRKCEKLRKAKNLPDGNDPQFLREIDEQIQNIQLDIEHIHEKIKDIQSQMVDINGEETEFEPKTLVSTCNEQEAQYLLEHCVNMAMSNGVLAAQKDAESKQMEILLDHVKSQAWARNEMLQFLMKDHVKATDMYKIQLADVCEDSDSESESEGSSAANGTTAIPHEKAIPKTSSLCDSAGGLVSPPSPISSSDSVGSRSTNKNLKARRKMATPSDLLFPSKTKKKKVPTATLR